MASLLQLARGERQQALIGIEPAELGRVRPAMPVRLTTVLGGGNRKGRDGLRVPQPIEVNIYSDDQRLLACVSRKVAETIGRTTGPWTSKTESSSPGDALDIESIGTEATFEGLDPEAVTTMVKERLSGVVATEIQEGGKMVGVRASIPQEGASGPWSSSPLFPSWRSPRCSSASRSSGNISAMMVMTMMVGIVIVFSCTWRWPRDGGCSGAYRAGKKGTRLLSS